jgi:hypothetical protein
MAKTNKIVSNKDRGSFLTEMALVLPFLFILLIGTIDLSIGMLTYLRVSRVAYEAARYGSSLTGMNESYDPTLDYCDQNAATGVLGQVHTRAKRIAEQSMLFFTKPADIDYRVSYQASNRQIHVCLRVNWKSIMPGFLDALGAGDLGGTIRATATAPYLFES